MPAIVALSDKLVFFLGVNTGFVTEGLPDARFVDFYQQRSSPDLYCAIVGNAAVPGGYGSNSSTPVLSDDKSWSNVSRAIRTSGSLPGIQLATAWSDYRGQRKFVAKDPDEFINNHNAL